jgi:hypothetical protein
MTKAHPLSPEIRLRVGVTGHRGAPKLPLEALESVRASVDATLAAIVAAANAATLDLAATGVVRGAASFVLVSSLAEGADRMVAMAGLEQGFGLEVVLPFKRAEYISDFKTPGSQDEFARLLAQASSVFEIDGDGRERPRGYEAAGLVTLSNIDLLIAIWDGGEPDGLGGTAQIVDRAVAAAIPVIWIEPARPQEPRLSWSPPDELPLANARAKDTFRTGIFGELSCAVRDVVAPPPEAAAPLALFLGERERRWNFCAWYPLLLLLFTGRALRFSDIRVPPYVADTRRDWERYFDMMPSDGRQRPLVETVLMPAFAFADHIAIHYAQAYRSAYVFNFGFAAIAVTLALGEFLASLLPASLRELVKTSLSAAEVVVIAAILITWMQAQSHQWHRRWLDYRRLAECLRHLRILAPIALGGPTTRPSGGLRATQDDWVAWYSRTVQRMLPLPNRLVDPPYLVAIRDAVLAAEIAGQREYHRSNAARIGLDHRLHATGMRLFKASGLLCLGSFLYDLVRYVWHLSEAGPDVTIPVVLLSALLPTIGAALNAIHAQGDFRTVAEQSKRTVDRLEQIDRALATELPIFARIADRIDKASDVMMADLVEWQTVFRTRPLSLPA